MPLAETWIWAVMFAANALPCTVTEICSWSMSGIIATEVMYCPGTCNMHVRLPAQLATSNLCLLTSSGLSACKLEGYKHLAIGVSFKIHKDLQRGTKMPKEKAA